MIILTLKRKKKKKKKKKKKIKKKNQEKNKNFFFFGTPREFYSCHLYSSSSYFNLYSIWNINEWNSEKKDGVMYLSSVFK